MRVRNGGPVFLSESLEVRLCGLMIERAWTLSVAETTAGGLICSRIVSVPGSSAFFERGLVPYGAGAKSQALGISESLLKRCGAVSEEVASAMAEAVGRTSNTTLGLAETGIAGPVRGRSPKPLGTAYIALWTPEGVRCKPFAFGGDRNAIRERIAEQALRMVVDYIEDAP